MTKTVGIIPAGGKAGRFHGIAKELLPVSSEDCALSRCIRSMYMGGANEIYIATNRAKINEHWAIIEDLKNIHLTAREFRGLWDFIAYIGERVQADKYLFAMPDTVYPLDVFMHKTTSDLTCGTFHTNKAGRFGILCGGSFIVDKNPCLVGTAWGVWVWSRAAMEFLVKAMRDTLNHTAALNRAIGRFGLEKFDMPYYYDFATFDDYMEFICSLT